MSGRYILGISAFYHDSAACLLRDGRIIAAAQEERFTRVRHDHAFPHKAIAYCLREGGITAGELAAISFYDKPFIKFERLLETYLGCVPRGLRSFMMAMPLWIGEKLWIPAIIEDELGYEGPVLFPEHHESHAASAFFPSPWSEAAVLTLDGVGEWATSSYGAGHGNRVELTAEMRFPHSLGLLYSAFTYFTGFKVNSGEYKVMGLAPYGEPRYVQTILDNLLDLKEDGSFVMDMRYFDYMAGLRMTNERFAQLFGGPPRQAESLLTQREMDLAASLQVVTEEIVLRMARHVRKVTGLRRLCLAGGVALNCVANGKLLRAGIFEEIWIQPAAGDAGGALGAALIAHHHHFGEPLPEKPADPRTGRPRDLQRGSYLGPAYSNEAIAAFLSEHRLPAEFVEEEAALLSRVAEILAEGKVIGWFSGRMEFGPRALGARSILGDPRSQEMQKTMNLKIKFREGFRPFAPSVLEEAVSDWFELDRESPYMLLVAEVKKSRQTPMTPEHAGLWGIEKLNIARSEIPAVTHVDYSARVQTVSAADHPRYHALIQRFGELTGCPILVNTSFNVRGEPIVESPLDAYRCFMRTGLDALILENHILLKDAQPAFSDTIDWRQQYGVD